MKKDMKKIITTVGTSLFENFEPFRNIENDYNAIKDAPFNDYNTHVNVINDLKSFFTEVYLQNNPNASAEITSILKIRKQIGEQLEVYLIASDTILSSVAAEILKEHSHTIFEHNGINILFDSTKDVIKGLQVKDPQSFENDGLINFVKRVQGIAQNTKYKNCVFNITGGYKAVIPYLTIIGQLFEVQISYIFENSDTLITIPQLPIQFSWHLAEHLYHYLSVTSYDPKNVDENKLVRLMERYKLTAEIQKNSYTITPLGNLFKEFVDIALPQAPIVFGFLFEYKFYEYYIKNKLKVGHIEYTYIDHSFKDSSWLGDKEIDLLLKPNENSNDFVAVEIKSFLNMLYFDGAVKVQNLVNTIKSNRIVNFKEFHLIVYIYNGNNVNLLHKKFLEIKNLFDSTNVTFKIFYCYYDFSLKKGENPYKHFMMKRIEGHSKQKDKREFILIQEYNLQEK